MDVLSLLLGIVVGFVIGAVILHFYYQSKSARNSVLLEQNIATLKTENSFIKSNLETSEKQKADLQRKVDEQESKTFLNLQ